MDVVDLKEILENNLADAYTFGKFIRERREALNKTVRGLAAELNVTPAYLSDIEKGNRYAPKSRLEDLLVVLKIPDDQKSAFYDLAALTRGEYEDINPYLGKQHWARVALRKAERVNLSDEQWIAFIEQMEDLDDSNN